MDKVKLLIIIEGGVVQEIRSTVPCDHPMIELLDMDDIEAGDEWRTLSKRESIDTLASTLYPHEVEF